MEQTSAASTPFGRSHPQSPVTNDVTGYIFRATDHNLPPLSYLHRPPTNPQNCEPKLNMVKVTVNGKTIAESNETIVVENNHYFPPSSVKKSLLTDSQTRCGPPSCLLWCSSHFLTLLIHRTVCPWKGSA